MRWMATFMLIFSACCVTATAQAPEAVCLDERAKMPDSWQPPAKLQKSLNPAPWSQGEAKDAQDVVATALDEMIGYFKRNPRAVQNIWDDSVEALIEVTYAGANRPEIDARARNGARDNLDALVSPYLDHDAYWATCDEFEALLPVAIFAHRLFPPGDERTTAIAKRTNVSLRDCGSIRDATGVDYENILAEKGTRPDNLEPLFDLYLWSLWFTEAELYPAIALPAEARTFAPRVWEYFKSLPLPLPGAGGFKDGIRNDDFIEIADLASHIAHIPTGTHRFTLYVDDFPQLYRFHRENFYPAMLTGDMDLFASFVDTLRQYGCTPENDAQVRDGTRYLLKIFHDNNDTWMSDKNEDPDADPSDYDRIHRPWTAALGLRERRPEQPLPGTYGGLVRRWLPPPR